MQGWLLGGKQANQRCVTRCNDCRASRGAVGRFVVNENGCIALLNAVVGIEYRRVNNRSEPLARGVSGISCNKFVDKNLIPFEHLIGPLLVLRSDGTDGCK